jgi:four helix bundle protein
MAVQNVKELTVYIKAYQQAMEFFEVSKHFPQEERYALTSQGRRSSRSVCQNLREAWAKRRYEAHFVSKLTDCDGENSETDTCWDFAHDCGYLSTEKHKEMTALNREAGKMLGSIIRSPEKFLLTPDSRPLTPKAGR